MEQKNKKTTETKQESSNPIWVYHNDKLSWCDTASGISDREAGKTLPGIQDDMTGKIRSPTFLVVEEASS
jgi:hypothetical protein